MPMRELVLSLAAAVVEEAARVPASRPPEGPFRVSLSFLLPQLQMPVPARPSSPLASAHSSTASAHACADSSLFLAGVNENGGVPMDLSQALARALTFVVMCLWFVLLLLLL